MSFTFGTLVKLRQDRRRLGHAGSHRTPRRFTADEDTVIIARYATDAIAAIAESLGRPHRSVASRTRTLIQARELNPRTRFYQPRWSPEELDYLIEHRGETTDAALAQMLGRTETAVFLKGKRLGIARKDNFFTSRQVAQILGIDDHKVVWLAERKRLRLKKSAVSTGPSVAWRCEIAELERFLRRESAWYDPSRITEEPWRGIARKAHADPWLTARQAATVVGLSLPGFQRCLRAGEVAAMRLPGPGRVQRWRIRRSALEGFKAKRPELVGHTPPPRGTRKAVQR